MTDQKGIEIALVARAASIRFTKSKDRYDHRFVVKIADQQIPLLESYLQDPLAPWPTDPAIQQLVVEPIGHDQTKAGFRPNYLARWMRQRLSRAFPSKLRC
jgi:hypothetical protein